MGRDRSRSRDRRDRSRDRRDRSRDRGDRDRRDSAPPPREDNPEDDVFKAGRTVVVKGLQKNPEKNGSVGKLKEFSAEKGRWVVELSGGNNNFKEDNLELMPDNSDIINDKDEPPTAKIYIQNLAASVTEKDLQALFGGCGMIAKVKPKNTRNPGFEDQWPYAVKMYKPGRDNGDAAVTYMDPHAAKAAIKTYNRYKFQGSKIKVEYAGQGKTFAKVELQLPWHLRPENMGKMDSESGGGGGGGGAKPGDWTCADCGAAVFASRSTCFKCGAAKPFSNAGGDSGGGGSSFGGRDRDSGGGKGGGKGKRY